MAHVLVVEDDEATRTMLRAVLEDAGHVVSEARDGMAALDILRASPQALVVVLDLVMPPGDGVRVLRAVRNDASMDRRHRYLAMTAGHLPGLNLSAELASLLVRPVIAKPFHLADILAAVEEAATAQLDSK